jgi:hypothetical protein
MTERERWIVYPLLFFALGTAVKDKILEQATYRNVVCNALVVTDREGRQQVVVASDPEGGLVRTFGNKNGMSVVLGNTDRLAGLMLVDGQALRFNPGSIFASAEPARRPNSEPAAAAPPAKQPQQPRPER